MIKKLSSEQIPNELLSKSGKLTKQNVLGFLKENTLFLKYHEGQAIKDIKEAVVTLENTIDQNKRNGLLKTIGCLCFKLFDYPCVNNVSYNDANVLYQAIPRHWIIINAAFSYLKEIPVEEKKMIFDVFLNKILMLQRWENHSVLNSKNKSTPLSLNILKEKILIFALLNESHDFSMRSKELPEEEDEQHLQLSM